MLFPHSNENIGIVAPVNKENITPNVIKIRSVRLANRKSEKNP